MATKKFLTDTDELAAVTQSALWLHVVDTTDTTSNAAGESNKLSYANIIASSAELSTGTEAFKFVTPSIIREAYLPDGVSKTNVGRGQDGTFLTIDTGLVLGWNAANDQPVLINTSGSTVDITYDVDYIIDGAKGFALGTDLAIATATTAYFSDQSITVDAANTIDTNGDTCFIRHMIIRATSFRYMLQSINMQLQDGGLTCTAMAYTQDVT